MNHFAVMIACDNIQYTRAAAQSILTQDIGDVHLIVLDNASTDGTREWLWSMQGEDLTVHSFDKRLSVAECWNWGVGLLFAKGSNTTHVLVVNNDVQLREDTYRRLLADGGGFVTAVGSSDPACALETTPPVPDYNVRIMHFYKMGFTPKGVVHVGTNEGYEIQWYLQLGLNVIGFEPFGKAARECQAKYPEAVIYMEALGEVEEKRDLRIAAGDGCGSTFLQPKYEESLTGEMHPVQVRRLDSYTEIPEYYDCLVVDVQGMELQVLRGAGEKLTQFKYLNIECSAEPRYEGEAPAREVVGWLKERGYTRVTPIEEHNDILFVRDDVLGRSPHPDFSCFLLHKWVWERVGEFDEGFKGAFCEDWDYHVRLHQAGVPAYSIPVPFYHVGSATINNAPPKEAEAIGKQAALNREYFKRKWGVEGGTPEYYALFGQVPT